LKLAASQQLYAYWDALRGARGAPERNDVEPGAIRGVLADTFILEFSQGQQFPIRVIGSRTNALFGRELRGTPFLSLWREPDQFEIARVIESVADGAQPFLVGACGAPLGAKALDLELLLLPLRHHGATHARLIGCCTPAASPPWLGLLPVRALSFSSLRAISSHASDGLRVRRAANSGSSRRGHLFVYRSHN
jgi:hypothetical protein